MGYDPQHAKLALANPALMLHRSHPWHGVPIGDDAPQQVTSYIEMTSVDTIKYELDKSTGILKLDRPQLFSNVCPALYGFIPQTYCAEEIAELCMEKTGRKGIIGDGDPLDICILTEKRITHGNLLIDAIPIGGLRMVDDDEADDKIIAIMKNDAAYADVFSIEDCRPNLVTRLRHYFLTYKQSPDSAERVCTIPHVYGREEAHEVIDRARKDYSRHFPGVQKAFFAAHDDSAGKSKQRKSKVAAKAVKSKVKKKGARR